jgi:hypothetical protein
MERLTRKSGLRQPALYPRGFAKLDASQELKKFEFPKRPDLTLQLARIRILAGMFAPPLEFEAFDFQNTSLFTTHGGGFFGQLPRRQSSLNWWRLQTRLTEFLTHFG